MFYKVLFPLPALSEVPGAEHTGSSPLWKNAGIHAASFVLTGSLIVGSLAVTLTGTAPGIAAAPVETTNARLSEATVSEPTTFRRVFPPRDGQARLINIQIQPEPSNISDIESR